MNIPSRHSKARGCCLWLLVGLTMAAGFMGCGQPYGRFSRNAQVGHAFESGSVPPELRYFYAGRGNMPYAIMGIDPSYTNESSLWIPFEPSPDHLRRMSANIYGKEHYDPRGFTILSPDGEFVGIWFSSLHFPPVKVDQKNRSVDVRYRSTEIYRER